MAEVQTNTESGEITQNFVQFILMQQQQALFALGKHPNPPRNAPPANFVLAKVFIDQLTAIRVKTRGNLSAEERSLMDNVIAGLQTNYAEATRVL